MGKKVIVTGPVTAEEVEAAYKASRKANERERLQAIRMGQQGKWTMAEIGEAMGRGRATIGRWIKAYREGGLEGLLERGHGGRRSQLTEADRQALKRGLAAGRWKTATEIGRWLERERGVKLKPWSVYYWLKRLTGRWKVPRKSHAKKDPKKGERFKREIVKTLTEISIPVGRRVRVWIQDEHRYGLISVVRRCWTWRGHRPTAPYQAKYQWGYVSGAADVVTSEVEFCYLPTVSLGCSLIFLEQLVATDPEAIHMVLWDQAGFHFRPDDPRVPQQVRLVPLPPYSPELNPMEMLWDQVKRGVANEIWDTLEQIEAAMTQVLEPLW